MDALTIFGAVVGGIDICGKIYTQVDSVVCQVKNAPDIARDVLSEVKVMQSTLRSFLSVLESKTVISTRASSKLSVSSLTDVVEDCVRTLDILRETVKPLADPDQGRLALFERFQWALNEKKVNKQLERLHRVQACLHSMVIIFTGHALGEVATAIADLDLNLPKVRFDLPPRRSLHSTGAKEEGHITTMSNSSSSSKTSSTLPPQLPEFEFEAALHSSTVYRRARGSKIDPVVDESLLNVKRWSHQGSDISSIISSIALPLAKDDLANPEFYAFNASLEGQIPSRPVSHLTLDALHVMVKSQATSDVVAKSPVDTMLSLTLSNTSSARSFSPQCEGLTSNNDESSKVVCMGSLYFHEDQDVQIWPTANEIGTQLQQCAKNGLLSSFHCTYCNTTLSSIVSSRTDHWTEHSVFCGPCGLQLRSLHGTDGFCPCSSNSTAPKSKFYVKYYSIFESLSLVRCAECFTCCFACSRPSERPSLPVKSHQHSISNGSNGEGIEVSGVGVGGQHKRQLTPIEHALRRIGSARSALRVMGSPLPSPRHQPTMSLSPAAASHRRNASDSSVESNDTVGTAFTTTTTRTGRTMTVVGRGKGRASPSPAPPRLKNRNPIYLPLLPSPPVSPYGTRFGATQVKRSLSQGRSIRAGLGRNGSIADVGGKGQMVIHLPSPRTLLSGGILTPPDSAHNTSEEDMPGRIGGLKRAATAPTKVVEEEEREDGEETTRKTGEEKEKETEKEKKDKEKRPPGHKPSGSRDYIMDIPPSTREALARRKTHRQQSSISKVYFNDPNNPLPHPQQLLSSANHAMLPSSSHTTQTKPGKQLCHQSGAGSPCLKFLLGVEEPDRTSLRVAQFMAASTKEMLDGFNCTGCRRNLREILCETSSAPPTTAFLPPRQGGYSNPPGHSHSRSQPESQCQPRHYHNHVHHKHQHAQSHPDARATHTASLPPTPTTAVPCGQPTTNILSKPLPTLPTSSTERSKFISYFLWCGLPQRCNAVDPARVRTCGCYKSDTEKGEGTLHVGYFDVASGTIVVACEGCFDRCRDCSGRGGMGVC